MNELAKNSGVVISGQVSEVRSYTSKKTGEEKYSVRLFIPGSEIIQVGLPGAPDPKRFVAGEITIKGSDPYLGSWPSMIRRAKVPCAAVTDFKAAGCLLACGFTGKGFAFHYI